jgi:hypothetical protein
MIIELTPAQQEALRHNSHPPRLRDPKTGTSYVLVREELYERLKSLLSIDSIYTTAEMLDRVMAEDDANDPYLVELQQRYQGR